MAPITLASKSLKAEAFSVVEITSPEALRGLRRALRVTPRSTTSRRAAVNSRVSCGLINRVICLQNLAFEIGDKHRIGGVLDQTFGIGLGLVQFAHVTEDADGSDYLAFRIAQSRGVESGRNDFA